MAERCWQWPGSSRSAVLSEPAQMPFRCQQSCVGCKHRILTPQSPRPGPFPPCISTESEQNFYRKLTADPSSPFVGQNWVACQSSVSHCGGNRTTIIGFDKSEPAHREERRALEKRLRSCQQTGERTGVWGKSPGTGCCLGHWDQALGY